MNKIFYSFALLTHLVFSNISQASNLLICSGRCTTPSGESFLVEDSSDANYPAEVVRNMRLSCEVLSKGKLSHLNTSNPQIHGTLRCNNALVEDRIIAPTLGYVCKGLCQRPIGAPGPRSEMMEEMNISPKASAGLLEQKCNATQGYMGAMLDFDGAVGRCDAAFREILSERDHSTYLNNEAKAHNTANHAQPAEASR